MLPQFVISLLAHLYYLSVQLSSMPSVPHFATLTYADRPDKMQPRHTTPTLSNPTILDELLAGCFQHPTLRLVSRSSPESQPLDALLEKVVALVRKSWEDCHYPGLVVVASLAATFTCQYQLSVRVTDAQRLGLRYSTMPMDRGARPAQPESANRSLPPRGTRKPKRTERDVDTNTRIEQQTPIKCHGDGVAAAPSTVLNIMSDDESKVSLLPVLEQLIIFNMPGHPSGLIQNHYYALGWPPEPLVSTRPTLLEKVQGAAQVLSTFNSFASAEELLQWAPYRMDKELDQDGLLFYETLDHLAVVLT